MSRLPKSAPKNSNTSVPYFRVDQAAHSRPLSSQACILMQNFNTNSPLILGSHGWWEKFPRISNNSVPCFGTDQTALTASNQPKHRKTLKNGKKTQVGRKSYLLELLKTRKPRVHALSSPRRTASLLAPSTADGRIHRIFREKFLSLKHFSQKSWLLDFLVCISRFGLSLM